MPGIRFHYLETDFKLPHPRLTAQWLQKVARREKAGFTSLGFIFCTDDYLATINHDYLSHDDFTDVITFNYGDTSSRKEIEGEVYISIDRVKDNASAFAFPFDTELHRVMVHGALHLLGYNDKTPTEKRLMREKEEAYLSLR